MATVQTKTNHQGKHHFATTDFNSRVPHEVPSFTLADVKSSIPPELFDRPALKSLSFLAHDISIVVTLVFLTVLINPIAMYVARVVGSFSDLSVLEPYIQASAERSWFTDSPYAMLYQPFFPKSLLLGSIPLITYNIALTGLWIVYFWIQGLFMTGLWVLGHEMGHGAFFSSKRANDCLGLVLHSFLLVPFFAWSISHRRHHSHCGDMELDEVHLPPHINDLTPAAAHGFFHNDDEKTTLSSPETFLSEINSTLNEFSLFWRLINTAIFTFLGWWVYLLFNISGRRYPKGTYPNHFLPTSPIYSKDEKHLIIIGDIFLLAYGTLFYKFGQTFGFPSFLFLYFIPYMVTNWWLVTITLLQHTHSTLPHFSHDRWNYVQGAAATIDRDFGPFYNWALHNINDSHVAHHMFSQMPHYHALKATPYVKKALGPYYAKSEEEVKFGGVVKALWDTWNYYHFISEDNHPALTLGHKVVDEMIKNNEPHGKPVSADPYLKIINTNKEKAYHASPYGIDGKRIVDKEVYWFRTLFFHEDETGKKIQ